MDAELTPMPLVLMYHSVQPYDTDPYRVIVDPSRFARQMRWLHRRGLRGVSMRELLDDRRAGHVGLTFDDGYANFVTQVMPVLDDYGFTATVYVVAGALGGHNSWDEPGPQMDLMTRAAVRHAAAAGVEIGSHSLAHVHLPRVDDDDLADQVKASRDVLADLSGGEVTGFCYPYGDAGEREIEAVRAAGYDYAVATKPLPDFGRHSIPRTYIGDRDHSARLFAKVARHRLTTGRAA